MPVKELDHVLKLSAQQLAIHVRKGHLEKIAYELGGPNRLCLMQTLTLLTAMRDRVDLVE